MCLTALIKRHQGKIQESLQLFQAATCLNPNMPANLKQVGRSLYLLGKHKAAIDVYCEAQRIGVHDWEVWHNMGLCYMYLKQYDKSIECFNNANELQRHDVTYMQLGKVCARVSVGVHPAALVGETPVVERLHSSPSVTARVAAV